MGKYIKTTTTEVVDVSGIRKGLHRAVAHYKMLNPRVVVRLVMSAKTKNAIKASMLPPLTAFVVAAGTADYFEGHPVDINDSLEFGEVRFTAEL